MLLLIHFDFIRVYIYFTCQSQQAPQIKQLELDMTSDANNNLRGKFVTRFGRFT